MKHIIKYTLALATAFSTISAVAQEVRLDEYNQARKFTADKLQTMLFDTRVDAHWMPDGEQFWYKFKTGEGTRWYVVNPAKRSKQLLFDTDKLAAQLSEITHDAHEGNHLQLNGLEARKDGLFAFSVRGSQDVKPDTLNKKKPQKGKEQFFFTYNPKTKELKQDTSKWDADKYPQWANISPDGQTVIYAKDLNLYRMSRADYEKAKVDEKDSTIVETQLTTFGEKDFGFGMPYSTLNTDTLCNGKRKGVYGLWSPDSKHFVVTLSDSRKVKDLWVINSMAKPRPTLESYKYEMPGDKDIPQEHLFVFNLEDNSCKEVNVNKYKDQTLGLESTRRKAGERDLHELSAQWMGDNGQFYLERYSRDLKRGDVCLYVIGEDTLRTLIHEESNTYLTEWLDDRSLSRLELINGGKQLVKWSERTGWAHLYLYDNKGEMIRPLTEGAYHVHGILRIDEKARMVYFAAMGKTKGENPYYQHIYRVSLDGGEPKRLTSWNAFHTVSMDDKCRYMVDNFSRVDTIPATRLVDANGKEIMKLETADMKQLLANGYKFPEQFTVKAADGVTDLWGVMYKPFDFDSTKVYPIIDYVYPGPQVEGTVYPFYNMGLRTDRLAQAGFIVVSVGNRGGHPDRSAWYHTYGYGNLRDYGLADQKAAIEQLANRYKFIDINRVGIHGHSGGGFMSTAAILQYPDFFHAAVSCAGNHDNRIYNRWWSETHHGVKERIEKNDTTFAFSIATNPELAARLKGHLMLVTGDIDNNVHPGNTLRVVDALIRSRKRFDMLVLPQQRHGFGDMNEYFYWRLVDYFSEHLKGKKETSVDIK